jgi:single-strand DNA-binding protein
MNSILLGGNLTDKPELRYTGSNTAVANATLATNERYKNSDGELVEEATFHDLVIWGNQAEVLNEYAEKGQYLVVRGTIQENEWEDNDGNTRRDKEVKVLEFDFGPQQPEASGSSSSQQSSQQQTAGEASGSDDEDTFQPDDDLPF